MVVKEKLIKLHMELSYPPTEKTISLVEYASWKDPPSVFFLSPDEVSEGLFEY